MKYGRNATTLMLLMSGGKIKAGHGLIFPFMQ
jgi:hypothetical protein